ncbi:MAG TPA: hydroxysqualene dehydroxylase HpnE [Stellaceae bacterium]|jgi:squalene-associated FAD-dependent desaturase
MTAAAAGRRRAHVVGAGLAGLSAAVRLAASGWAVSLYESGRHAGGRCRSYFDAELGCRIDNGNHLLLSGNHAALAYVREIGAEDTFEAAEAAFPFLDVATGERWALRPNGGALPWWILDRARRVPATAPGDYLKGLRLALASPADTVAGRLDPASAIYRRLWEPLAVAALNTAADEGAAILLWRVVRETLGRGAAACRPMLPRQGLSESLVDPALRFLEGRGASIRFGARLREIAFDDGTSSVGALSFDGETVPVAADDAVILAMPAAVAPRLVPDLPAPTEFRAIVNAHYRTDAAPPGAPPFIGLVGGNAEWVFRKPGILSVTVSAAERFVDRPAEELVPLLWRDVAVAYGVGQPDAPPPPWRIVKEKRATFAATPAQLRLRPGARTAWRNLILAGDWTDTGLPATIEGAIRSGHVAAATAQTTVASGMPTKDLSRRLSPRMVATNTHS